MDFEYYEKYINKKTKFRWDSTTLFHNPEVFDNLINDLIKPFKNKKIDVVVGLDAFGFILAAPIALRLKKSFVPIRKGGKLRGIKGTVMKTSFVDYSKKRKTFEINKFALKKGDKVLIVDEWIETGASMKAAIRLIERSGAKVEGISVLCSHKNENTQTLFDKYDCHAIKKSKFQ